MNNVNSSVERGKESIFKTILSSPGMTEPCKINLVLTRQNIILLSRLIEVGILPGKNNFADEILGVLSKESADALKGFQEEILKKGNLSEFYEKLKLL